MPEDEDRLRRFGHWMQVHSSLLIFLALVAGGILGYYFDARRLAFLIPAAVFIIVYPAMVNADIGKIVNVLRNPTLIAVIILLCYFVGPLISKGLSDLLFAERKDLAIGFILFSFMPSVSAFIGWIRTAQGDINTAVVVQALTLVLTIIAVPAGMLVLGGTYVTVPAGQIVRSVLQVVVFPLILGVLTRRGVKKKFGPQGEATLLEVMPNVSTLGMICAFTLIFSQGIKEILGYPHWTLLVFLASVIFYGSSFIVGTLICKLFRFRYEEAIVAIFTSMVRNNAIGLAISASYFPPSTSVVLVITFLVQASLNTLFISYFPHMKPFFALKAGEVHHKI